MNKYFRTEKEPFVEDIYCMEYVEENEQLEDWEQGFMNGYLRS